MYKGEVLVNRALRELGTRGAKAKAYCGLPMSADYCDAFVTWLFYIIGMKHLFCSGSKQVYCPTTIRILYKQLADIPIYLALPGDVILMDWEPNNVPNHIAIVRNRVSDLEIDTVEGNTSGGIVAKRTRPYYIEGTNKRQILAVFRPQYPVSATSYSTYDKLDVDGEFGFNSIAILQKWLGAKTDAILKKSDIIRLQKKLNVTADGSWGVKTSKALQKLIGAKADGFFGPKSVKALQTYLNKHAFSTSDDLVHEIMVACREQSEWMQDSEYGWESKPTIKKSKKKASCVTWEGCVLQRLKYLKPGQYIWHTGRGYGDGKVYGTNEFMKVTYMKNKKLKKLKKKLNKGDIVLFDDNRSGEPGSGGHVLIMHGGWKGNDPYVWDNNSAYRIRDGRKGPHTYDGDRKVLAKVELLRK